MAVQCMGTSSCEWGGEEKFFASNLATLLVKGPAPAHPIPQLKDSHVSCQLEGKGGVISQRNLCICELEADLSVACRAYMTIFAPATVGTPCESACEQR